MELIQYEKEYRIPVYEIGADARLNPHSLFNYLQDIASEHAVKLRFGKDDLMKENRFWVLSRMAADIEVWPEWEDTVIVRTWPRGTDKLFALRDYDVFFPDGRHVASASSSWLVVDRTTRRVQRPDSLLTLFNTELPVKSALGRNAEKLEPLAGDGKTSDPYRVRTSDLDVNMHTNNVMYVKWIFDSYDPDFRALHLPSSVEINYIAESRRNDEIIIRTSGEKEGNSLSHSVIRCSDSVELCRVRIDWKDCRH